MTGNKNNLKYMGVKTRVAISRRRSSCLKEDQFSKLDELLHVQNKDKEFQKFAQCMILETEGRF